MLLQRGPNHAKQHEEGVIETIPQRDITKALSAATKQKNVVSLTPYHKRAVIQPGTASKELPTCLPYMSIGLDSLKTYHPPLLDFHGMI
jgi:hypothetical protein